MGNVAKYNLCKGVSTVLSIGTPIVTLACCGDMFIHRSETALSAAGMFVLFIIALIFKDKIAEKWKVPSAFILSTVMFVLLILVENITEPMKYVCIATMITSGVDELTFKRIYKRTEALLPDKASAFKILGFIFTTSKKLESLEE